MRLLRSSCRASIIGLTVLLLSACAHEPAFRAELPASIETEGRQIAIIADLQQTSGLVRFLRRREENSTEQRMLLDDLTRHTADLAALVIVGDLVYTARSRRDWRHLDSIVEPFAGRMPVLPAMGNHDYPCFFVQLCRTTKISRGMLERFPWFEPGKPYAVSGGELMLLFIDSETGLEAQGAWLDEQLALAEGSYRAALVFFHRPAFTNSIDFGAKPDLDVQQFIVPALEAAELPVVVFSGHVHGYEYIVRNGVHYVTTAGGGGPRGAMADERPFDRYRGPDCPQSESDEVFRPYNYVLADVTADALTIDVRGFCRDDEAVGPLDEISIPLESEPA